MTDNPYSSPESTDQAIKTGPKLTAPALTLLVVSGLWSLVLGARVAILLIGGMAFDLDVPSASNYFAAISAIPLLYLLVIMTGTVSMLTRGSYVWALTTSVLALVPGLTPFYVIGIPLGIWAIVRLKTPDVRATFRTW